MADEQNIRARIFGTGHSVPAQVLTNSDLEKMVDTSDAWIVERTGIHERRILEPGRVTSDLAAQAAREACEMVGWDPKTLDCIILGTVTPDMPMPATAVYVQQQLGCSGAAAFDLSAACAGFLYGIAIGNTFVRCAQFRRVCVIGVEVLSRVLDWTDRNTCVVFGDGAGAVVLGPEKGERGILSTHLYADGEGARFLHIPGGGSRSPTSKQTLEEKQHVVKMNGRQVFAHAVRNISEACETALTANQMTPDDVDRVIAHQASERILQGVAERCSLPIEKFYINLGRYGNTSSASIPIALDELVRRDGLKPGERLLFCAFGAGFSWGSAIVRW
ncbi:MAG: beta-ketoacyl-ACP synthase III [Candidatus Binatia bacterium]